MSQSYAFIKEKKKVINETQATTKPVRKKQTVNNFITLSEAMVEYPQSFDENKISVVQKFINKIDPLHKKFLKIDTLYLSSNNIRTLEGLEQFSCLKSLSLANNEINDAGSLYVLEQLPTIEVLTLSGNPICKIPNYRSLVISLLPCLKTFDGKPVTPEERHKSEVNLRTQTGLLDLMLGNYCELIKLNNLHRKLEMHRELMVKDQRFVRNFIYLDVGKWKKMYDYQKQLDSHSKNMLKANLLQDVNTLKSEMGLKDEQNDLAFSELILRQQQKIAELLFKAEEAAKNMAAFQGRQFPRKSVEPQLNESRANLSTFSNLKSPKMSTLSESRRKAKQVTIADPNTPSSGGTNELRGLKSALKADMKSPDAHDRDLFQKLSTSQFISPKNDFNSSFHSLKSHVPQSISRPRDTANFPLSVSNLVHTENRSPSPGSPLRGQTPQPARLLTSPSHKDDCCRKVHKRGPGSEVIKSPLNKRLEEKERLIENLARDLRIKTQELIKYEGFNKQLTEKLKQYQYQNHENVKVAEEEIENMAKELEKSAYIQNDLEETVTSLKQELGSLYKRNYELEQQTRRLQDVETKANINAKELEDRTVEDSLGDTAHLMGLKRLKAKAFAMLKRAVQLSKTVNQNKIQKAKKVMRLVFCGWTRFTAIHRFVKEKSEKRVLRAYANLFYKWHNYTMNRNKMRGFITEKSEKMLAKSLLQWKQYVNKKAKKNLIYDRVNQHFIKKTKKRVLKRFAEIRKRVQFDVNEEKTMLKKAQKYNVFNSKRQVFLAWKKWTQVDAKPYKIKIRKGKQNHRKRLLKLGFKMWTTYMKINKQLLARVQKKITRKNTEILSKSLKLWKYYLRELKPLRKKQDELKKAFIKKRLLKIWVDQSRIKTKLRLSMNEAIKFYNVMLEKKVFKHLLKLRQKRKQLKVYANAIQTKNFHSKTSKYFTNWYRLFKNVQEARREAKEMRREALYTYLQAWKKYHNMVVVKKIQAKNLERHLARVEKDKNISVFQSWLSYTRLKKRNKEVVKLLGSRRRISLYKNVMFELIKYARQSVKQNLAKLQAKFAILEANDRDNHEFVKDIDAEKLEMIDKARLYQEELVQANFLLEERNREINSMKRVIQQYEKNEKVLVEEVSLKNTIVKELETKLHRTSSDNQFVYEEYEKDIEMLKNERSALQRKVDALENELEFKQRALLEAEKILLEKSSQAQGIVNTIEKKFANSVKMASEFRTAVELKEDQVNSLMVQLQKALEEKQDLKNKLAEALNTTRETRDFYEGRIKSLEGQNLDLISTMEYMKDDLSKQQQSISTLKTDLKKSQHKLEIAKDQTLIEDEKYLRSLRREASPTRSFKDYHPEFQSPRRLRSPGRLRKEISAERRDFSTRKQEISKKIHILENYMGNNPEKRVYSPPSRLNRSQAKIPDTNTYEPQNTALSIKSLRGGSPIRHDNEYDLPTKESLRPSGFLKVTALNSSIISDKSPLDGPRVSTRSLLYKERSPSRSSRSPPGHRDYKTNLRSSVMTQNDADFERMRRERLERRADLEKRLENLTQSLQADLRNVRNRALDS